MEIKFVTEDSTRKMLHIYHAFSQMPYGLRSAPMVLGEQFYRSYMIYKKITNDNGSPNEMFEKVIEANALSKSKPENVSALLNELNKIKFEMRPQSDPLFKMLENGIGAELKKREDKIDRFLMDIFGFPKPRKLMVVLAENLLPNSSSGYGITSKQNNVCMAGFLIGEKRAMDIKHPSSVIIHEMLHSFLSKSKTIKESSSRDEFMESVFDYFVPDGMFGARLGLVKTQSIRGYLDHNVEQRPESKEMAIKLLPAMEEYEKIYGKEKIWNFLAKRGFRKYIYKKN